MKNISVFLALVLFSMVFFGCCDEIKEDGKNPNVTISVIYKDQSGAEIRKDYTSTMTPTDGLFGFSVFIPLSTAYSLMLTANDPGCFAGSLLEKKAFRNNNRMIAIDRNMVRLFTRTFSRDCPKSNILDNYKSDAHNNQRVLYIFSAKDFSGLQTGVTIIIVPRG